MPGVTVSVRETGPPLSQPTDTGPGFMVANTDAGPTTPRAVTSFAEWTSIYGGRSGVSQLYYDSAEGFFRVGGSRLWTSRVYGPGAATAFVVLNDTAGTPAPTLRVEAAGAGEYGNDLNVGVHTSVDDAGIPVGSFKLVVKTDAGVTVEESPVFANKAAAFLWAAAAPRKIVLVDQASALNPARTGTGGVGGAQVPAALTGGLLDASNITEAQRQIANDRFTPDMGNGQVFDPGATSQAAHTRLDNHAALNERNAIKDDPNTAVVATLIASAIGARGRFGAHFAPFLIIRGVDGTTASVRTVPPSALVAGVIARNDGNDVSISQPAAGDLGLFGDFVLGVTQSYSAADQKSLNAVGVNVIRNMPGGVRVYGWRTSVDPATDPKWTNFGHARLKSAINALAKSKGERFVFKEITPELIGKFNGMLAGEILLPLFRAGSIYGTTPDEAFRVDTGPQVNTPDTIAAKKLRGIMVIVPSEFGEEVEIELVMSTIPEGVGA
jgi:hypothetical protein